MGISLQVVELTAAGGPEQDTDGDESEDQHSRNEAIDDFHRTGGKGIQLLLGALNRVRMRAEFPITARELRGMDTAATRGVTRAAMARGTMTRL